MYQGSRSYWWLRFDFRGHWGDREGNFTVKDFEEVWLAVVSKLQPGEEIKNWGSARGYTGGTFKIEQVHNSWIGVFGGEMTEARNVSKGDFAKVYAVWDQYLAGNYPRAKMTNLSQNTTYILSILRCVLSR
jgi:hypothetical protein